MDHSVATAVLRQTFYLPIGIAPVIRDYSRWLCELRDHGEPYGVEAQIWQNEEFLYGRRFDRRMDPTRTPRELAVQWAEQERIAIEADAPGRLNSLSA